MDTQGHVILIVLLVVSRYVSFSLRGVWKLHRPRSLADTIVLATNPNPNSRENICLPPAQTNKANEDGLHYVYWDVVPRILRTSGKSHNATLSLTCYVTLSRKFRTETFLILSTWWWSNTYTLVAIFRCCEQDYLLCRDDQLLMMYWSLQTFSLTCFIFTDCIHLFYYCLGASDFSWDTLDGDIHGNGAHHRCFPATLPSPIGLNGEQGAG